MGIFKKKEETKAPNQSDGPSGTRPGAGRPNPNPKEAYRSQDTASQDRVLSSQPAAHSGEARAPNPQTPQRHVGMDSSQKPKS
jgi:hypothetical protein